MTGGSAVTKERKTECPGAADDGPPRRTKHELVRSGGVGQTVVGQRLASCSHLQHWAPCDVMHSSSSSVVNSGLGATCAHTPSFRTWRRARPARRTACRWDTRSSSSRIWCRWPCGRTLAARSRWWRPCRCDTSFHRPPAELWRHLRVQIGTWAYSVNERR